MEVKNLLLKAIAVSVIGCFGAIGMYYQTKFAYEKQQKEIAYEQAFKCYEELFFKLNYESIINNKNMGNALNDVSNRMKEDGFSNAQACRLMMDSAVIVQEIKKSKMKNDTTYNW